MDWKNIYTEKEYRTMKAKGGMTPMYCRMEKNGKVIYAVLMTGYYEAEKLGYKYVED